MKVGLFFGSFNPIHLGHLILASVIHELSDLDQVWFVVSPQNPFKSNSQLLPEADRLDLVREAIKDDDNFFASDIEFSMPRPSYTIDTLTYLREKHPSYSFRLIIGEDNLKSFPKWKNHENILKEYGLIVYPRPNATESDLKTHPNVELIDAPEIEISATLIRRMIREGRPIKYLVPESVRELILSRKYYQ